MVFMSTSSDRDLPQPPWSSLRERPPARPPITRESIVDAALRIVDAEGLDALSMRHIGTELHCQASALYAHVSGKPELLQLLIDHVVGEVEVPDPDPERWQEQIKDVMRGYRAVLIAHGDLAGASLANIPTGHNTMLATDRMIAILLAGGLPNEVVAYAIDVLPQFVTVSSYEYGLFARRLQTDPEYFDRLNEYFASLPAERFPNIHRLLPQLAAPDDSPEQRFEFGLDMLVRGIAAMAVA
jgi:AcrR family transcriptional regulator